MFYVYWYSSFTILPLYFYLAFLICTNLVCSGKTYILLYGIRQSFWIKVLFVSKCIRFILFNFFFKLCSGILPTQRIASLTNFVSIDFFKIALLLYWFFKIHKLIWRQICVTGDFYCILWYLAHRVEVFFF